MARVNPDPHKKQYRYLPSRCVTALFDTPYGIEKVVQSLREAEFAESDIRVFAGSEGADQLDVDAEKQSTATRILQAVTKALADDGGYLERAAGKLEQGGAMVSVSVGEDEQAAERASNVLKQHAGKSVQYWSDWTTEKL